MPVVFAAAALAPQAHRLLFVLAVLSTVPLAALLSHATESVAAKTGDAAGGLRLSPPRADCVEKVGAPVVRDGDEALFAEVGLAVSWRLRLPQAARAT